MNRMLLTARHIMFVLALLVATTGDSKSQQPAGGEPARPPQANPTSPQQPPPFVVTKDTPFVIEVRPAPPSDGASNQDITEKAENDRKLVEYSYALDVLTAILAGIFFWQGILVVLGARRDRILARAYLWPGPGHSEPSQPGRRRFYVTVHNTGKTTGVITNIYYRLSTEAEFQAGNLKLEHLHQEDVIPPDMAVGTQKLTGASVELIGSTSKILHGYIVYTDVFKKAHQCPWKHWLKPDGNSDPLPGCYSEWS
jgi:hypothetical protein